MISVRVKTPLLEVAVASDKATDSLTDVVKALIDVGQSNPVQSSLQAPIVVRSLPQASIDRASFDRQLSLFPAAQNRQTDKAGGNENTEIKTAADEEEQTPTPQKRLAHGKGERAVAYNKTLELIAKGFFNGGGKTMGELQRALCTIGYSVGSAKLADSLLRLVREGHLARTGERGSYLYEIPSKTIPGEG